MQLLRLDRDIPWLPIPNEITLILDDQLPPAPLITSALALAFYDQNLLMTNLNARGWDIPGGHIETGESPEATMHREVMEETGARLENVRLLGYQRIRLLSPCPPNYRYPYPDSYQILYIATIADLLAFLPTEETHERALFAPHEASSLRWVQENREMYDAALSSIIHAA
jgi:8-oxo-dGTP diphosphatase